MSDDQHPSHARRAFYFVLGALVGGVIGYGFMASGPPPTPSVFDPAAAPWVFGLALVCGALAALSPSGFWRRSRK